MSDKLQRSLTGFAAGVMVAASVWSLIIPAMEQSEHMGKLAFIPAFVGVWLGFLLAGSGSHCSQAFQYGETELVCFPLSVGWWCTTGTHYRLFLMPCKLLASVLVRMRLSRMGHAHAL